MWQLGCAVYMCADVDALMGFVRQTVNLAEICHRAGIKVGVLGGQVRQDLLKQGRKPADKCVELAARALGCWF